MRANHLKQLWRRDAAAINGWLSVPAAYSAEAMSRQGWDSLTIDLQHGITDYLKAADMLAAMAASEVVPLARVPWREPGIIMKMLDAGALGVICPMVNSRLEAEEFAAAMRYPPKGRRSFGPARAALCYGGDYAQHANDEVLAIAMIETQSALSNVEEIAATPGIDALYIGPADLSLSLGEKPGFDSEVPKVVAAIDKILAAAKANNIQAGIHNATAAYARKMADKGFRLLTVGSDSRFMIAGAQAAVAEFRGGDKKGKGAAEKSDY
jgi:4-hydroxy-2-oxoheptanedioate aldolase